ncbi:hypothetical protein [Sphingobium boeckii]|uniref:Uncharacterized protein n=1 Tax=Sphingobium boeckii TaxID=1082345 RepID=A0A7W9AF31_9SPHN|nr:hypothetical protein [Sphingobium boeckii]MBB5684326.1 hypothetical protein [Sphingobium boeckii]
MIGANPADDLRHGVSPAGHAVLDFVEDHQPDWDNGDDLFETQFTLAMACIARAQCTGVKLVHQRDRAIEAAARLIDAVHTLDMMIDAGRSLQERAA